MGASATPYWRRMKPDQLLGLPSFTNDCKAWADWLVEIVKDDDARATLRTTGCEALLTFKTDGVEDAHVTWVTPNDLFTATFLMSRMVAESDPETSYLVELYARGGSQFEDPRQALSVDLHDLSKIAAHVAKLGVKSMTVEVNW